MCRDCIGAEKPRIICRECTGGGAVIGFEYKSEKAFGNWPLVHVCSGIDAVTGRPRIARGVIAIGQVAVGGIAVGGLAVGLVAIGGVALGLLGVLGGLAIGLGVAGGGLAVGSVAVGGMAVGFEYAIGGTAFGPAVISGTRCDQAVLDFLRSWIGPDLLPPDCPQ